MSKKFINASFTSSERDNIEVLWQDPESEEIYIDNVEVNSQDVSYKELMGYTTFDDIVDATAEKNKRQRRDFELAAVIIGQQEGWIPKEQGQSIQERIEDTGEIIGIKTEVQMREEIFKDINDMMFSKEVPEDKKMKELLFMLKLYVFDQPQVAASKDKELKKVCRRAKTPFEALKAAVQLLDE